MRSGSSNFLPVFVTCTSLVAVTVRTVVCAAAVVVRVTADTLVVAVTVCAAIVVVRVTADSVEVTVWVPPVRVAVTVC